MIEMLDCYCNPCFFTELRFLAPLIFILIRGMLNVEALDWGRWAPSYATEAEPKRCL